MEVYTIKETWIIRHLFIGSCIYLPYVRSFGECVGCIHIPYTENDVAQFENQSGSWKIKPQQRNKSYVSCLAIKNLLLRIKINIDASCSIISMIHSWLCLSCMHECLWRGRLISYDQCYFEICGRLMHYSKKPSWLPSTQNTYFPIV